MSARVVTPAILLLVVVTTVAGRLWQPALSNAGVTDPPDAASQESPAAAAGDLRARAYRLLQLGKHEEAAAAFAEILAKDPSDSLSVEGRTRALITAGRWQEALDETRHADQAEPRSGRTGEDLARMRTALGEALYRAGLFGPSGSLLEKVIASTETPPARALMTLALVRVAEGKDEEAAALFSRALTADPNDRDVLFWAAGAAANRVRAGELLERYLAISDGDDPDRIEAARGTIRLYKALGERRVWVPAGRPQKLDVPLYPLADRSGKISGFVLEIAGATGKPIRVLLDTGSTGLFLLERIALKAGFLPLAEETTFGGGGSGRQPSRRGLLPTVSIGALRFTDALVSTTTEEIEPTGRYHGLLGLSMFEGYRVTLDLSRGRLILESPSTEGTAGPATLASSPESPYWTVSNQLLVEAGTSDARSGLFLFDTGASTSLVSLELAGKGRTSGLGETTAVRGYGGPIREARKVTGQRLRFQALESPEPSMNAADLRQRSRLGGVEISGFLGLDLLSRTRITIDTVARRILVQKPTRK